MPSGLQNIGRRPSSLKLPAFAGERRMWSSSPNVCRYTRADYEQTSYPQSGLGHGAYESNVSVSQHCARRRSVSQRPALARCTVCLWGCGRRSAVASRPSSYQTLSPMSPRFGQMRMLPSTRRLRHLAGEHVSAWRLTRKTRRPRIANVTARPVLPAITHRVAAWV